MLLLTYKEVCLLCFSSLSLHKPLLQLLVLPLLELQHSPSSLELQVL